MEPYQLSSKYRLSTDAYSFVRQHLVKKTSRETGEVTATWVTHAYYRTLDEALVDYAQTVIKESARALPDAILQATNELRAVLAEIKAIANPRP